jgi:hypothetical protein
MARLPDKERLVELDVSLQTRRRQAAGRAGRPARGRITATRPRCAASRAPPVPPGCRPKGAPISSNSSHNRLRPVGVDEQLKAHRLARVAGAGDDQVEYPARRRGPGPSDLDQFRAAPSPAACRESAAVAGPCGVLAFSHSSRMSRAARPLQRQVDPRQVLRTVRARADRSVRRGTMGAPTGARASMQTLPSFTALSQAQSFSVLAALTTNR